MANRHDVVARALAKKFKGEFHRPKGNRGPDVKTDKYTIAVETMNTISNACGFLRGYRGAVYIAGVDSETVEEAKWYTEGTTVGVMDATGRIRRRSTRKKFW